MSICYAGLDWASRTHAACVIAADGSVRDALSLWHLLSRLDEARRHRVYDVLARLVPPPPGVTADGVVRADPEMLALWWDELGLGSSEFWRSWTAPWTPREQLWRDDLPPPAAR